MLNNQQAIQRVQQTFLYPYSDENYSIFISDLLNNLQTNDNFEKQIENDDHIESFKRIGCYEDNNGDIIDILSVKVKNGAILERTRARLRDFIVDHIRNSPTDPDGCLVAFYADEFNDWRFSFVKMSYKVFKDVKTGKIKTKEEISEPKRYSFLIGSDEPSFTAQKQMIPLLESSNVDFSDIVDAFSTERVTNEFYQAYRALFEDLKNSLAQIRKNDPKIKENFKKEFIKEDDFAKKLLGQIVFIYFIQRKGWLGIKRDSDGNFGKWGSGDKKFIRNLFNKKYCQYNNFFNDVLEHLFYNGLGTENSDNYFSLLDCKIPFLNGGIFEPLNDYNWQETDIIIEDKTIEEILNVFDRFNFTVREESELDVDVAVDPEMLGRVFENLLPENIRKGKGAYYTPRSIVNYMCQESIISYLFSETAEYIDFDTIQDFIKRNNVEKLSRHNAQLLDSLLKDIKICDPAIGSGAFPMGLLNLIVKSRSLLCSLTGKEIDKYDLKRYAIINSIYGVDLDPGAVEIAKLRLFLSLIVDEQDFDSIEPLPNLDFQIMQGNSLIEEFYGITLDINKKTVQGEIFEDVNKIDELISNLYQAQTMFSNESNYKRKRELKNKVENSIIDIFKFKYNEKKNISDIDSEQMNKDIEKLIHGKKPRNFFPWKLYFADIFRSNGGFDVVIANPPYLREKGNAHIFEPINNSSIGKKYHQGKMDFWFYFLHKSIDIKKSSGTISFITSRYWIQSAGATKLIERINDNLNFYSILDIGKIKVFDNVVGHHLVSIFSSGNPTKTLYKKVKNSLEDISLMKSTDNIDVSYIDADKIIHNKSIRFEMMEVDIEKNSDILELGDILDCSIGVQESPDKITKKMLANTPNKNISVGDGVFVITDKELSKRGLSLEENNILKPYVSPKDVSRYHIIKSNKYLIYSDKLSKKDIENNSFPSIKDHLDFYKDYISSSNKPYGLHRPREKKFFEKPKLICNGMFKRPSFAYDESGIYSGFSFTVMIQKNVNFDLKYILAILNSKLGHYWFIHNSKKRGVGLDVGVQKFRLFPIKNIKKQDQSDLVAIVNELMIKKINDSKMDVANLEDKIDKLIYKLYKVDDEDIKKIESTVGN